MKDDGLSQQQKYQLVQADYDGTAEFYDGRYNTTEEFASQFADFLRTLPRQARVVDIGSGPGMEASRLAQVAERVVAVDLSATMLSRVKAKNPAIATVQANMRELPFPPASFDAIWCSRAIIHVPQEDVPATLQGFYQILKPEGVLGLLFRIPDEGMTIKEEFLSEEAPNSKGLIYYRNLYPAVYMRTLLAATGFIVEKEVPGISRDNEVSLYMRARKNKRA